MSGTTLDDFDVLVRRRGETFYVIVHELGLIGSGPSLDAAWAECVTKHAGLVAAYRAADALHKLPSPAAITSAAAPGRAAPAGLGAFVVKMVIVFVTVMGIVWAGSSLAARVIRHNLDKVTAQTDHLGGKKFWGKVETEIGKLADRPIPPEKQAEITGKLRRIVAQAKPFTDELAPLFACPTPSAAEGRK